MPEPIRIEDADPAVRFLFLLGGGGRQAARPKCWPAVRRPDFPPTPPADGCALSDLPLPAFRGRPLRAAGRRRPVRRRTHAAGGDVGGDRPGDRLAAVLVQRCAATKLYLDHWARWMGRPDLDYRERMRGKTLWAVASCASPDPADADPLAGMLRRTARHLSMRWGGLLLAPGPGRPRPSDTPYRAAAGPCDDEGRPVGPAAFFTAAVPAAC